jgi:hypothetical protein
VPKKVTKQVCVQVKKCVEEQVPACGSGASKAGRGKGGILGHGCGRGCKKGC